jgi:hypothetical protein
VRRRCADPERTSTNGLESLADRLDRVQVGCLGRNDRIGICIVPPGLSTRREVSPRGLEAFADWAVSSDQIV